MSLSLQQIDERLAEIEERQETITEVRLLLAEKQRLETEIAAERPSPEVKRLLEWVDADVTALVRRASLRVRGNGGH